MSNNIAVSITADVADLQVKRAIMSAELKAATKDLNDFAKQAASSGSTDGLREGMLASASAAQTARNGIAQVNAELKEMAATSVPAAHEVEHGFAGISVSVREMGMQVRETVGMMGEMREAMIGFGELLMAAFAIEEIKRFAESIGEAAEKTLHLSQQLGLSMAQTQGLGAATTALGVPFDSLTKAMGILDKHFATNPKLFKDLGIDIPRNADQMTVLNAVMDKFERTADGPNKTALALTLMGKAGKEMIPFMNEGSAGLSELIAKANEYGAVNVDAAEKGVQLAESLNEGKLAMEGLKLTLSDAFAPLLTSLSDGFNGLVASLTESYREGGTVKIVFQGLVDLFTGFGEIVDAMKVAFNEAFGGMGVETLDWGNIVKGVIEGLILVFKLFLAALVGVADLFKMTFEQMAGQLVEWYGQAAQTFSYAGVAIDVLKQIFITLGTVVYDALTLHWGSIAADWDAGMAQIDNVVRSRGAQIVADAKATHDQAAGWFAAAANTGNGYGDFLGNLFNGQQAPKPTGIKLPKTGGEDGGDLSKAGKTGKKPKDELVQQLDDELTAKKLAWAMEQDAQGTAIAYSLQAEADYWKQILDGTNLSAKDRAAIETKYLAAHSQLVKERIAIAIDGYKQEMAEADKNAEAKLAIAQRELEYIGKMYGTESKEYAAAQAEIVRIKRQADDQKEKLDEIRAQKTDKINLDAIATEEALAKHRVAMGVETNAQLLAQEQAFENRKFAIEQAASQRARALVDPKDDPVRAAQLDAQLEQLERQHQAKLTQIDQQAVLQRTAIERAGINSVASSWAQAIGKMITLQQGFGATVKSLWVGLQQAIGNAIARIIESWLAKEITAFAVKHGLMATEGALTVTSEAAKAGAGGIASMAAAPFPLNLTAPAFGASMAAAAASFAPAAMAEGGWWDVPGSPITQLHPKEMVLPAWAATPLRSMLGGGAANNNAPFAASQGRGDTHNHYENHFHGPSDKRGIEQWFMEHHAGVGKAAAKAFRNGAPVPK